MLDACVGQDQPQVAHGPRPARPPEPPFTPVPHHPKPPGPPFTPVPHPPFTPTQFVAGRAKVSDVLP